MHSHAPEEYVCPFCSLIQGIENEGTLSRPEEIVYQDQAVVAFVSSHQWPNNAGNVLVVPREHYENIYDLPQELAARVQSAVKTVALALKDVYRCDGVSTRQHNEPAGSQDVWHYHVHVTPCYHGDDFYRTRREFMAPEERFEHAARLRAKLEAD